MSDTKFPYSESSDMFLNETVEPWFHKCMEDFPTSVVGFHKTHDGRAVLATLEVPKEVTRWFNKWFSQFVEGA